MSAISGIHTGTLDNVSYPAVTSSFEAYRQGYELLNIRQLTSYLNFKIRANVSLGISVEKVRFEEQYYDDTIAPTTVANGASGSLRANLGRELGTFVNSVIERRDLGQSEYYTQGIFEESDPIERDPKVVLMRRPEALIVPLSFVLASNDGQNDGVIDVFDTKKNADFTNIELPYPMRGIKAAVSVDDRRSEFSLISPFSTYGDYANPFLDSVENLGSVDVPGAFSDAMIELKPVVDESTRDVAYASGTLDAEIRNQLIIYGSTPQVVMPRERIAAQGFVYENQANTYDSLAFGGLKK